ncbi:MAG: transcriptional regulator [Alphaproteobacteria bacterium]|nr:MAG: transcriptional regulator [Alphaproteobacteria bacterium]
MPQASNRAFRSACPIATSLDLVGDRWTLVLVRDLLMGKRRFAEFLASPERITTNILTDRLARMEQAGLIAKTPYQQRPLRFDYRLTDKGAALWPVLQAFCRWANHFMPETWTPPARFMAPPDGP